MTSLRIARGFHSVDPGEIRIVIVVVVVVVFFLAVTQFCIEFFVRAVRAHHNARKSKRYKRLHDNKYFYGGK